MTSFDELRARFDWRPIPGCPGRWVLRGGAYGSDLPPEAIVGGDVPVRERLPAAARDPVAVAGIAGGGLLSYRKPDGSWVHTLNDAEGLRRKTRELEIDLAELADPAAHSRDDAIEGRERRR